MRLIAFSPRLAGLAAELLGEPAIRICHDNALSKEPGCGRTPWHHDAEHFPLATLQAVTARIPVTAIPAYMGPLALAGVLMCVTWLPICHSTRLERHMTQLSHVVSSRVMWLSMRARSPSARSSSTRRCASTPLGPQVHAAAPSAVHHLLRRRCSRSRIADPGQRPLAGLSARCRARGFSRIGRHLRHRGLGRRPGCRGLRRCAGWRRWPGRRCSGRRSSAGPRRRARRGGRLRWRAPRSSATGTRRRAAGRRGGGRAVTCTGWG